MTLAPATTCFVVPSRTWPSIVTAAVDGAGIGTGVGDGPGGSLQASCTTTTATRIAGPCLATCDITPDCRRAPRVADRVPRSRARACRGGAAHRPAGDPQARECAQA